MRLVIAHIRKRTAGMDDTELRLLHLHDGLRALAAVTLMVWFFVSMSTAAGFQLL